MVEISIVVPTYQREAVLRETLPGILGQDLETGRFEVVVVVDGSTDGTLAFLDSLSAERRLRVVWQENRGLAAARNRGAREAGGRVVLFLDDDAHASPGLAGAHLARHREDMERVVMGPFRLLRRRRRSYLEAGVERWAGDLAGRLSTPGYRIRFTDISFANTSLPRSLWERTGGFDESFRRFGNEDYEYGVRLLEAGTEFVFEPAAEAMQDYRKSFTTWCREWRAIGRADLRLWERHRSTEGELYFSRIDSAHPLRRYLLRAGLGASWEPAALLAPVRWLLSCAWLLGLRGRPFDLLKWLPADFQYGLGVRDAVQARRAEGDADLPDALRLYFEPANDPASSRRTSRDG